MTLSSVLPSNYNSGVIGTFTIMGTCDEFSR
jgi:hypothetical protein